LKSNLLIFLVLCLALFLRLIVINQSYWLDEAIQVLESRRSFDQLWQITADFHPPLFHYLAYFWLKVSVIEWWARLLPLSLGLFTIYFLYQEIKEVARLKTAILGSLFLATSSFHIYYSQEFRPYMLSCLLATASYYFFIRFVKADKIYKIDKWLGSGINLLGLYSLYYFPFVLVSQLLVLSLFYRPKVFTWLKSLAISGLFFMLWLPMFFKQLNLGWHWANRFMVWRESVSVPLVKVLPLTFAKFWLGNISLTNKLIYALLILGLLAIFIFLVSRAWFKEKKITQMVLIFLLVPVFLAFFTSIFIPTIAPKRLLLILPQFFFLLALSVRSLNKNWQWVLVFFILFINVLSLNVYYFNPRFQREQWRQAINWVENNSLSDSVVLFEFSQPFGPWMIYQTGKLEAVGILDEDDNFELKISQVTKDKKQIFLFQYLVEMSDPERKVANWLIRNNYLLKQTVDFPGVGLIYEYIQ